MTCIVGLINNGKTYIGADSLASDGFIGGAKKNKKLFKLAGQKDILAGYTSSFRMGQLLQYSTELFDELTLMKNEIDEKYMVTNFIPSVRELFKKGGYDKDDNGGNFLISVKDKLYEVQSDYSILEPLDGFASVGCGQYFALGSLETTKDLNMNPVDRIRIALECAEKYSVGVGKPFYIINSENDEVIEIK